MRIFYTNDLEKIKGNTVMFIAHDTIWFYTYDVNTDLCNGEILELYDTKLKPNGYAAIGDVRIWCSDVEFYIIDNKSYQILSNIINKIKYDCINRTKYIKRIVDSLILQK